MRKLPQIPDVDAHAHHGCVELLKLPPRLAPGDAPCEPRDLSEHVRAVPYIDSFVGFAQAHNRDNGLFHMPYEQEAGDSYREPHEVSDHMRELPQVSDMDADTPGGHK